MPRTLSLDILALLMFHVPPDHDELNDFNCHNKCILPATPGICHIPPAPSAPSPALAYPPAAQAAAASPAAVPQGLSVGSVLQAY